MKVLSHHCFFYLYILSFFYDYIAQYNSPKAYIAFIFFMAFILIKDQARLVFQSFLIFAIGALIYEAPMLSNHATFYLLSSIILLIQTVRTTFQDVNSEEVLSKELFHQTAVILISSLLCVYFWTGLHKLNYGFIDIKQSCAVYFNQEILKIFNLNDSLIKPKYLISSVLSLELIVPFLFLIAKLRLSAIVIMSAFHLILAPLGFYDFSFICFTLYTLINQSNKFNQKVVVLAAALAFMSLLASLVVLTLDVFADKQYILVVTSSLVIQLLIIFELIKNKNSIKDFKFRMSKLLVFVLLILNLHAMSPYLGLYTGGTFNMFSNLRTESNLWNHMLFPESLKVFNMQTNLYLFEPKSPKDFYSPYEPHEKSLITYNHAQLILNDYKKNNHIIPKIYSTDGRPLDIQYLGLVEKKFSNFRIVPIDKTCSW